MLYLYDAYVICKHQFPTYLPTHLLTHSLTSQESRTNNREKSINPHNKKKISQFPCLTEEGIDLQV